MSRWLCTIGVCLLGGASLALAQPDPPPLVALAEVQAAGVAEPLWVPATLVSRRDALLASEVAGRLVAVAQVGDRLRRGDVVARVDDRLLQLELRAREAEVGRLQARLAYLGKQVERIEALAAEQITSRRALDELTAEREMASHELESARIRRETTAHLLERCTLKAPFAGVVARRDLSPGSYVAVGQAIARLVDLQAIEASASAPIRVAPWVRAGATVEVRGGDLRGGEKSGQAESRLGRLRAAVPVADVRSRSFEIRVALDESPWPVGAAVAVAVPQVAPSSSLDLTVPRDALVLRRDATWVWVVEGETVRRIDVSAGADAGDRLHVRGDGLTEGAQVVVRGGEGLRDGQTVRRLPD
ncbi:MAG: efflux RND transporter periplasmic adaptor subunit [Acidobacteriota bacterium]